MARFDNDRSWRAVEALKSVANELGTSPTAVALAWLLSRPVVSSVIFGARTLDQLKSNLAASGIKLPAELKKKLDDASAFELGYPYDFCQRIQGRW